MPTHDIDLAATPLRRSKDQPPEAPDSAFNIEAELAALDELADWLDSKFEIPGTGIRFGLDPILGLVPVIGDTLSAIPSGHIVLTAHRLGVPGHVLARMLGNIGLDMVIGLVPMLGDLLDAGFKANRRNVAVLRAHFDVPAKPPPHA